MNYFKIILLNYYKNIKELMKNLIVPFALSKFKRHKFPNVVFVKTYFILNVLKYGYKKNKIVHIVDQFIKKNNKKKKDVNFL